MGRLYATTIVGTFVCIAAALFFDSFNWASMSVEVRTRAILLDIFLPTILAAPLLFFFMSKLRELALAHERLTIFASTDALTGVLNRSALLAVIEGRLAVEHTAESLPPRGALLILDADNFKSINDTYGHGQGDVALCMISDAAKSVLRATDLMGRIGGEEFCVFLPDAGQHVAEAVGERMRHAVNVAAFAPAGAPHRLSVSIGGAVFDRRIPLSDLLRIADQQLYAAKRNGRNRVSVSPIVHYESLPAAAAA
jgi:diguanylate cyclase